MTRRERRPRRPSSKGGFKKVALLHDKSSYAKGLADESRKALEKAGVEIVLLRRSDAR